MVSRYVGAICVEINNGALVNRAVSEAEMGSPTRGEDQVHMLLKLMMGILNGVKTYTSMSKALTHIIVAAYIEELKSVGFFLVDRNLPGVELPIIGTY
ncbi:acyl-CoA dehydrogenase [Staphylococcus aureus]|uniref:Acyl-CoA dehydrogenase n=1 Tax=Staphylococcus aureus TaxID=1280 RepID=A0A2X2JS11_STAAU|nr:acyl-CoA dehydrogenase [Staphylococcus aureus]